LTKLGACPKLASWVVALSMDDDLDWDELMLFVRDGRVVPVVGSHLLRVEVDGRATTIESVLARDLAGELGIDVLPDGELRLSEIAFRHL
jgi:hypothetical protein